MELLKRSLQLKQIIHKESLSEQTINEIVNCIKRCIDDSSELQINNLQKIIRIKFLTYFCIFGKFYYGNLKNFYSFYSKKGVKLNVGRN